MGGRQSRGGDQDSRESALRDCEDDDGDELNDQNDQDHFNVQRSFKVEHKHWTRRRRASKKNHIIIQNHNGDGFWLWGISPLTKLTHFKKILEKKRRKKKGKKTPKKKKKKKKKKS